MSEEKAQNGSGDRISAETTTEKAGVETTPEKSKIKVTSANDWEHAELGDEARKEKFLKLMGAAKEDHKGKIVIGEHASKHKGDDPDQLNKSLEEQFQHGLDRKLTSGYKSHKGLGFSQEEDAPVKETPEIGATPDSDVVEERRRVTDDTSANENEDKAAGEKRSAGNKDNEAVAPKRKPMMMFVKASDDS
ncbi:small acidic protein-like [Watersipora subatra]|uniref:small acidic protein-like n=1 Tax=Watersipora subatra TaxID=2589382 RepID=UPI00355B78C1